MREREYPEPIWPSLGEIVYKKMCFYIGIALGYMFKGFFFTAGGLVAYALYLYILTSLIKGG